MCYCIWHKLYDTNPVLKPKVKVADVKENLAKALETGENPFEWLWEALPDNEKLISSILANTSNKPMTTQELEQLVKDNGLKIRKDDQKKTTDILKEWDIIEHLAEDKFSFRVELFRRWLVENKQLAQVQQELDSSDNKADNFYQAGYRLLVTDQLEPAIDNLEKAIKLNPNHISASTLLIDTYLGERNWEKAWKTAKALSLLRPIDARSSLNESLEGLIVDQDEETQLRYYEETLKIDPEHTDVKQKWLNILKRQGDEAYHLDYLEKALKIYQKAELSDKMAMVEGDIAYKAGDLEKALEVYQHAGLDDKVIFIKQKIKEGIEMITIPNDIINVKKNIQISKWPITIYQYQKFRNSKGYSENIRDNENREDVQSIINLSYIDSDNGEFYPDIYHYLEWLKEEYQTEYRLPTKE